MAAEASETAPNATLSVQIDIGGQSGAWDDHELVNAYDAALVEFHIHNPGPGSWLDKATAALAKGQPLPGANAFGTEWYGAAKREVEAAEASKEAKPKPTSEPGPSKKRKRLSRNLRMSRNPYSPSVAVASPLSPTYDPPSPGAPGAQVDGYDAEDGGDAEPEEAFDPMPEWDGIVENYDAVGNGVENYPEEDNENPGCVLPPPSSEWQPGTIVSRDEAIGYALHAQYWAGYWMGVARGAGRSQPGGKRRAAKADVRGESRPPAWAGGRVNGTTNGLRR